MQLPLSYPPACLEFISCVVLDRIPGDSFRERLSELVTSYYQLSAQEPVVYFEFLPAFISQALSPQCIDRTIPITAAWQFIRLAAKLYDDVEDGTIRDGLPETINLATGCLFAAQSALARLEEMAIRRRTVSLMISRFARACLDTCAGQQADLSASGENLSLDPDGWLKNASLKSGALFAWAAWAGAAVSCDDESIAPQFEEFGRHLGILVQIADDYNDLWGEMVSTDLAHEKSGLPLCYARLVARAVERETLERCLSESGQGNLEAMRKVQEIVKDLGGQSYLSSAAWLERQRAACALEGLPFLTEIKGEVLALFDKAFPALTHLPYEPEKQPG